MIRAKWSSEAKYNIDKKLPKLKDWMRKAVNEIAWYAAEVYKHEVVDMIENQTVEWTPLSEVWQKKKDFFKLSPLILKATGDYVGSFEVEKNEMKGQVLGDWELGRWLEHGTDGVPNLKAPFEHGPGRMPARPHLMPALVRTKPYVPKFADQEIRNAFSRY